MKLLDGTGIEALGVATINANIIDVVAVSTESFGASLRGLRATHRPSAEDVRRSRELLTTMQQNACAALAEMHVSG